MGLSQLSLKYCLALKMPRVGAVHTITEIADREKIITAASRRHQTWSLEAPRWSASATVKSGEYS